jgi:phosphoribosyl-ATP pyrophosphohydrolase
MEFEQYEKEAISYALYPREEAIVYPSIGVVDEGLELIEKCTLDYDDKLERKTEVTKEAGDTLWYMANLCHDLEIPMADMAKGIILPSKETYVDIRLRLMIDLQRLIGKTKKRLRGDEGITKEITLELLQKVYGSFMVLLTEEDINIDDALKSNIDKLEDRKKRNVLKGDGDNR